MITEHTDAMGRQRSFPFAGATSREELNVPAERCGSATLGPGMVPRGSQALPGAASRAGREGKSVREAMALMVLSGLLSSGLTPGAMAEGQVHLQCAGTLLEARGQAERRRTTARLKATLSLDAEAGTADEALERLQQRLASVRSALQALGAEQLQVSSPSTWARPREKEQEAIMQANLQVSASLLPANLQSLVRKVGTLPGVRLAPVETEADPGGNAQVRQELVREAYRDAMNQAQPLAVLIERKILTPVEIRLETEMMAVPVLRTMGADTAPPFNPDELNRPRNLLTMLVRFCAH